MMERLLEENQRHQSIQNSMLYRTVVKEKREIVKRHCLEKGKKKKFVQFSMRKKISDEENLQFSQ